MALNAGGRTGPAVIAAAALAGLVACVAPLRSAAQAPGASPPASEAQRVAPYAVTPDAVVAEMLRLARTGPSDFVVDLGSGDGRLVLAAVRDFGARGGFGVDIDRYLVDYANAKASEAGVADRVRFFAQDLFATDIGRATVVTIYLFPAIMPKVRDKLWAELAPGTRVVSHQFTFPGWAPDAVATVPLPHSLNVFGRTDAELYLYTVPARPGAAIR